LNVLRLLLEILATAVVLAAHLFIALFCAEAVAARPWRAAVYAGGYVALFALFLAGSAEGRRLRWDVWIVAGAAAVALSVALKDLKWPLADPTVQGMWASPGIVNYVFLPGLHLLFWLAGVAAIRGYLRRV